MLDAVVGLRDLAEDTVFPDDMAEGLPDPALFIQLQGGGRTIAVAVACPQTVAAVIEASTMGEITARAAPERRATRTDAMLVGGFLATVLAEFGTLVGACTRPPPVDGYEPGPQLLDARAAQMVLADTAHLRFRAELDFALGAKTGQLVLLFPADRSAGLGPSGKPPDWSATLENAVMSTSARLEGVLCKLKLPLARITGFQVGDSVPLTGASLDGVSMVGSDGSVVLNARLGRSGPVRAVRLFVDGRPKPAPAMMTPGAPMAAAAAMPEPMPDPMPGAMPDAMPALGVEAGDMAATGDLPDLPAGELPDLPGGELPDLPAGDLPDLPGGELPDLPGMDAGAAPMDPAPMELEPQPMAMDPEAMAGLPDLPDPM